MTTSMIQSKIERSCGAWKLLEVEGRVDRCTRVVDGQIDTDPVGIQQRRHAAQPEQRQHPPKSSSTAMGSPPSSTSDSTAATPSAKSP